jgi:D-psicose/D-tagatose/L-ribulose 3-epimerase
LKLSISNLAWGQTPLEEIVPHLKAAGINGIEIAPTAIWPDLTKVSIDEVAQVRKYLNDEGLLVSGIQSLLFGHPEYQLFDSSSRTRMLEHLKMVIKIGGELGADVAVFGSPKNRIKGELSSIEANQQAKAFLSQLVNELEENEIVLTLEPNAPDYGADFLVNYEEVVLLSRQIDSLYIAPQIDTGCLWMVDIDPREAFENFTPHHTHLSTPHLGAVPGNYNFNGLIKSALNNNYQGWLVIEMLPGQSDNFLGAIQSAKWLVEQAKMVLNND